MFIAHLPAGYLWTCWFLRRRFVADVPSSWYWKLMALGLVGSLLPDLDVFYFYFIDLRQRLHHGYWTHIPLYWFLLFMLSLMAALILKKLGLRSAMVVLFFNVCLHLVLDTIVGKMRWLAPFSSRDFVMFDVPAQYA